MLTAIAEEREEMEVFRGAKRGREVVYIIVAAAAAAAAASTSWLCDLGRKTMTPMPKLYRCTYVWASASPSSHSKSP